MSEQATPFPQSEIDRLYAVLADCASSGQPGRLYDLKVLLAALPEGAWQNFLIHTKQIERASRNGFRVDLVALKRARRQGQERNARFAKQERSSEIQAAAAATGKPAVTITGRHLDELRAEAIAALQRANDPPVIFRRPRDLVRFTVDVRGEPALQSLDWMGMRSRLADVAVFLKQTAEGPEPVFPPRALCEELVIFDYPDDTFPIVEGIARTPLIRPDGSIFCVPGYDAATKMIYNPAPGFELPALPDEPSTEEVAQAKARILELIKDFRFGTIADRDNFVGFLITPLVRSLVDVVPLALIDSPVAGAGKGLLCDLCAIIATGEVSAAISPPAKGPEWNKLIFSLLDSGRSFIIFDNLRGVLDSDSLEAALSKQYFQSRILGRTEERIVKNVATWAVTGNNITVSSDAVRRCYRVRIDPQVSQPYLRRDFKHPDLVHYCKQERANLLAALLTLIRSWYVAGKPAFKTVTIGTFTQWRNLVGGILGHAGFDQFLGNQRMLFSELDVDAEEWGDFFAQIEQREGGEPWTVNHLVNLINNREISALPAEVAKIYGSTMTHKETAPNPLFGAKLAYLLRSRIGTRFGAAEIFLEKAASDPKRKVARYQIKRGKASTP